MPRDGSGVMSKVAGTAAVPNTVIESGKYNATIDDIIQDLNNARPISAGGTGSTTKIGAANALEVVSFGAAQTLTFDQKIQSRSNIGVIGEAKRTIAEAQADGGSTNPEFYTIAYRDTNYRAGSGGVYRKQASEPSHDLKFQNTNSVWYALDGNEVTTAQSGAVIDGATDDTAAIHRAVAFAKTKTNPCLIISPGVHSCASKVTIDLPDYSNLFFFGEIKTTVSSGVGVQIGATSTTRSIFGTKATGINVYRSTLGASVVIVDISNNAFGEFSFKRVSNGVTGVYIAPTASNGGFSYNRVYFGSHHDSTVNVYLGASGSGYCNENLFFGGSFNHSTSWPAATASVNLEVAHFATSPLNNNRFYAPSFEDTQTSTYARAVNMAGENNVIYDPRLECPASQTTYLIYLAANATKCRVEANSFTVLKSNVLDTSGANTVITTENSLHVSPTLDTVGHAVVGAKSSATSAARVFAGYDSSGNETFYVRGSGALSAVSAVSGTAFGSVTNYNAGTYGRTDYRKTSTANENGIANYSSASVYVGGMTYSDTATAFLTSSDYRLPWKHGAEEISASGEFIDRLKVYNFPLGGTAGFLAHELQAVSPVSVAGEKDAVNADGEPEYQAVNYSSPELIANIVAELQSLRLRVSTLEAGAGK